MLAGATFHVEEPKKEPKKALTRLIRKSMRGDEAAFAALLKQYIQEIRYLAQALLDNKAETDDVVQEVAVGLYKGMQRLESPYAFSSFLFATVRNTCMYHNRQQMKRRQDSIEENELDFFDDERYTPEAISNANSLSEAVQLLVRQLPEKQRLSIFLYYYYDLSYKEIAETMGNTVSAVGTSINKAKKTLGKMIEDYKQKHEDKDVFHGVAVAPLIVSAFAEEFKGVLFDPSLIETAMIGIQQSKEAGFSQGGAAKSSCSLSAKLIAASLGVALVVGVGGTALFSQMQQSPQAEQAAPTVEDKKTSAAPFDPEVEIMVGETLNADVSVGASASEALHYPAYAGVQTSQGTPDSWRIMPVEEGGEAVVAKGNGARIGTEIFAALAAGSYEIEWTIKGEQGQQGTAERIFTIH